LGPLTASGGEYYSHLSFAVGKNLLPTESIIKWRKRRNYWPAQLFALVGSGIQTIDKEDEQISLILGAGVRLLPLPRFAMRFDMRENIVQQQNTQSFSAGKYLKNSELTFGLSYYL